jgi:hypothetical protein
MPLPTPGGRSSACSHVSRDRSAPSLTERGHGDADRPVSGYGVEDFTVDLGAFMDAIGLEAAMIVASSIRR